MSLFPHREAEFYFFGLQTGLANLRVNGLQLGLKKTVGKIMQPINSYTRFPEYHWFGLAIRSYLAKLPPGQKPAVLDVGSPKMFGFYLGAKEPVDLTLTDISEINIDEYQVMWKALKPRAKGDIQFGLQDARTLDFADAQFDVAYSMSVLEHIEGEGGDAKAITELLRVLKPGGLLLLSVPFGNRYVEQRRIGFSGAARKTGDQDSYFFQRIYDASMFQSRIVRSLAQLREVQTVTVRRSSPRIARTFGSMSENVRGLLGGLNPLLSSIGNRSAEGIVSAGASQYGDLHSAQDVYGDVILSGIRP